MLMNLFDRAAPSWAAAVVSVIAAAGIGATALAGDLNPPGGAVSPTFKTLDQVEPRIPIEQSMIPFTISSRGSYYLTGNVAATTANDPHVIRIQAPDVSLDLSGYTVFGESGQSLADHAILVFSSGAIEIHNGAVDGAEFNGIDVQVGEAISIHDLRVSNCGESGIRTMSTTIIDRCTSRDNGESGFVANSGSVLTGCVAAGNQLNGFVCDGSRVEDCASFFNSINGFSLGRGSSAIGCTSRFNNSDGFLSSDGTVFESCVSTDNNRGFRAAGSGNVFRGCAAEQNDQEGFSALDSATFIGCAALNNTALGGIQDAMDCTGGRCTFVDCFVEGVATSGGIDTGAGSRIIGCTVTNCGGDFAISTSFGIVENSLAHSNTGGGISVGAGALVVGCVATSNGVAGIQAASTGARIDSNLARGNTVGIEINTNNCMGIRNFSTANTNNDNYAINPGNRAGAISNDPSTAGPWDNFE